MSKFVLKTVRFVNAGDVMTAGTETPLDVLSTLISHHWIASGVNSGSLFPFLWRKSPAINLATQAFISKTRTLQNLLPPLPPLLLLLLFLKKKKNPERKRALTWQMSYKSSKNRLREIINYRTLTTNIIIRYDKIILFARRFSSCIGGADTI